MKLPPYWNKYLVYNGGFLVCLLIAIFTGNAVAVVVSEIIIYLAAIISLCGLYLSTAKNYLGDSFRLITKKEMKKETYNIKFHNIVDTIFDLFVLVLLFTNGWFVSSVVYLIHSAGLIETKININKSK